MDRTQTGQVRRAMLGMGFLAALAALAALVTRPLTTRMYSSENQRPDRGAAVFYGLTGDPCRILPPSPSARHSEHMAKYLWVLYLEYPSTSPGPKLQVSSPSFPVGTCSWEFLELFLYCVRVRAGVLDFPGACSLEAPGGLFFFLRPRQVIHPHLLPTLAPFTSTTFCPHSWPASFLPPVLSPLPSHTSPLHISHLPHTRCQWAGSFRS